MKLQQVLWLIRLGIVFVLIWIGAWAYTHYSVQKVEGGEMAPALKNDTYFNITDPNVRKTHAVRNGDMVSFRYVGVGKGRNIAARIIGMPGDVVEIQKGVVYVNGKALGIGNVLKGQQMADDYAEVVIPRDTVFLLCDARRSSNRLDSRVIGPVGFWALNGKFR